MGSDARPRRMTDEAAHEKRRNPWFVSEVTVGDNPQTPNT